MISIWLKTIIPNDILVFRVDATRLIVILVFMIVWIEINILLLKKMRLFISKPSWRLMSLVTWMLVQKLCTWHIICHISWWCERREICMIALRQMKNIFAIARVYACTWSLQLLSLVTWMLVQKLCTWHIICHIPWWCERIEISWGYACTWSLFYGWIWKVTSKNV